MEETIRLLETNRQFKQNVIEIAEELRQLINNFVSKYPDVSIDPNNQEKSGQHFENLTEDFIKQFTTNQKPAVVVYGANSSGKTTFVHYFLQIGSILPADAGPITTRIVKLTYASPDQAYAKIYSSLNDRLTDQQPVLSIDLSRAFKNTSSFDWEDVANQLKDHLIRPEYPDKDTFARWAKHFVEIGLPSPILQLGLDFYDTPGFLSNSRDEILNENLYELVQTIQPTLLFLYKDSAIGETEKSCFLALKQAVKEFGNLPKFFVNTQADAFTICKDERVDTKRNDFMDRFPEALERTRQKRYNLLLQHEVIANEILGGLPESVDDCSCFGITTAPTTRRLFQQCTELINKQAFERIFKFVIQSDRTSYQILADKVLSSIDEYFDLVLSTTYRTKQEWEQLRNEAVIWSQHFFAKINETLPIFIDNIHQNILKVFDEQKESIAYRSGRFIQGEEQLTGINLSTSSRRVSDFVKVAVYEEVLKVAANEAMRTSLIKIDQILNDQILTNKKKNELLTTAKRHIQFWEISGEELNRKRFFTTMLEHLLQTPTTINRFITKIRTRPFLNWYDQNDQHFRFEIMEALDSFEHLFNENKRIDYAKKLLEKMRQIIYEQKSLYHQNLSEWLEKKQQQFLSRIQSNYQYAIDHIDKREQAHQLTKTYSEKFAKLECRIIAAKDFVRFNGIQPTIFEDQSLGKGGFFTVHAAQWDKHLNLAVKRQQQEKIDEHPYTAFIEAHYHRAITNVRQANIVPLLYLYFNLTNQQLSIFMPKYKQSLSHYLRRNIRTIETDQILSFALIIARILDDLHQNDLAHRDIKSNNVLLDENNQCYLTDFGTAIEGRYGDSVVGTFPLPKEVLANITLQQMNIFVNYDATAIDVFSFGVLLHEFLPKTEYYRLKMDDINRIGWLFKDSRLIRLPDSMDDYQQLIIDCLQNEPTNRPKASKIIERIQLLIQKNETKPCAICLINPRTIRTHPCGHKVLCQTCRDDLRSNHQDLCIICKRLMQTDIQDDSNQTFYLNNK